MSKLDGGGLERREFLKQVVVTGGAAGLAAVGGAAAAHEVSEPVPADNTAGRHRRDRTYRETDHVRAYYRLARF